MLRRNNIQRKKSRYKIEPFEKYSSQYEDWFELNKYAYISELMAIKKFLPKDKKTVEIGVGSARFASPLGIRIGIDPSSKMQKIAQKRGILVLDAIAEKLPFRAGSFNSILMVTTICFLENIISAFKEAFKILGPGGSLIIGFIDKNSQIGKIYQERKNKSVFYKKATFYTVKKVIRYLKKTGFRSFEFFQTIFHNLSEIYDLEPLIEGYGEGSFVVIQATK